MTKPPVAQILESDHLDLCLLVRRTLDVDAARTLALKALADEGYDEPGAASSILDTATPEPGWWRTLGWCACGGGHDSEVIPAAESSRGSYPGVMFVRRG